MDGRIRLITADELELEAELELPDHARAAVTLAHPHPQYGGDMHSGVIERLFRDLPARGIATLRFNFRGVGSSEGDYDDAAGERLDVVAAIDALSLEVPDVPLVAVGYSFGAEVTSMVIDVRLRGWCLVAAPMRIGALVGDDPRPKLVVVPEHDQFCGPAVAAVRTAGWAATTTTVVSGADHFLAGRTSAVVDAVAAWLDDLTSL